MTRGLVYLPSDDPNSDERYPVWLERGDADDPADAAALNRALLGGGLALLGPWREPGGPATLHAAYETTRRQLNALTRLFDSVFVGKHSRRYGGNLAVLSGVRAESILGQRLIDPIVDEVSRPLHPAVRFAQEIVGRNRSVDATGSAGRSAFVFERTLVGDVQTDRMLVELRKRIDEVASDTGAWIGDARRQTWMVLANGTYFSRGGLFLMGDNANAILRGGSLFVEAMGAIVALGPDTTSDSQSGTSLAMLRSFGSVAQIGDIYGNSIDLVLTGSTSTFRASRIIVAEQAAPTGGDVPASGYGTFYCRDEAPYFMGDDGVEQELGGSGSGGKFGVSREIVGITGPESGTASTPITVPAGTMAVGDYLVITGLCRSGASAATISLKVDSTDNALGDARSAIDYPTAGAADPVTFEAWIRCVTIDGGTSGTAWEADVRYYSATGVVTDGPVAVLTQTSEDQYLNWDNDDVTIYLSGSSAFGSRMVLVEYVDATP